MVYLGTQNCFVGKIMLCARHIIIRLSLAHDIHLNSWVPIFLICKLFLQVRGDVDCLVVGGDGGGGVER